MPVQPVQQLAFLQLEALSCPGGQQKLATELQQDVVARKLAVITLQMGVVDPDARVCELLLRLYVANAQARNYTHLRVLTLCSLLAAANAAYVHFAAQQAARQARSEDLPLAGVQTPGCWWQHERAAELLPESARAAAKRLPFLAKPKVARVGAPVIELLAFQRSQDIIY